MLPTAEEGKFPVSSAEKQSNQYRQAIFPLSRESTVASAKTPTETGTRLLQRQHSHLAFPGVGNFSHSVLRSPVNALISARSARGAGQKEQ